MVKAITRSLNILIPEDLSIWFTEYAKTQNKTKTEIICSLLQGVQNGDAYSDVDKPVEIPIDGIESIVKNYLDNHLHSYVENILHSNKQADVDKPVESVVDDSVDNHIDDFVESVVDDFVDNHVDDSVEPDVLPIEAIANIAAPTIENPLPAETLSDEIAATARAKNITYRINRDGSVTLRSLVGTSLKVLKRMSDAELKAIGLFRTLIGANEKFFPIDPDAIASSAKPKSTETQSKSKAILTRPEALAIAQSFNPKVTGQNLYDWAKAALTAKSDQGKIANSEKLVSVGLVAVFTPENKPAWTAKTHS